MRNEEVYKSLLERVFENELAFYGELTFDIFRMVKGLDVSADGKILNMSVDFVNIIQDLAAIYKKLDGDLSLKIIRSIIEAFRSSYPDVDFPKL